MTFLVFLGEFYLPLVWVASVVGRGEYNSPLFSFPPLL